MEISLRFGISLKRIEPYPLNRGDPPSLDGSRFGPVARPGAIPALEPPPLDPFTGSSALYALLYALTRCP